MNAPVVDAPYSTRLQSDDDPAQAEQQMAGE